LLNRFGMSETIRISNLVYAELTDFDKFKTTITKLCFEQTLVSRDLSGTAELLVFNI